MKFATDKSVTNIRAALNTRRPPSSFFFFLSPPPPLLSSIRNAAPVLPDAAPARLTSPSPLHCNSGHSIAIWIQVEVYSDLSVDYLKMFLLYVPATVVALGLFFFLDDLTGFEITYLLEALVPTAVPKTSPSSEPFFQFQAVV
ncbi:hypothetical protein JCGZ_04304 [Jatropha curcas]|uniref:Uncharacterized protein n=1 Tax=Jatropha curcas TaxID=180498 RepID=A0A067L2P6_JATCU|nr:hypothetical protein JCGZ_04304 [Jatropha curcas]